MGKLVVIEGLDGSGKATQTALLSERLAARGIAHRQISFPDYGSDSSALVKMYLNGEFGSDPDDVNAYAASAFFAVDRYASWKTGWGKDYRAGGLILADRYATSNAIHQCAKLPEAEWPGFIAWLEDFEYKRLGIPKPDLVVYIDVDPALSQALLEERYAGTGKGRDIHEEDIDYLRRCREVAAWCVRHLGWRCVAGSENGAMRSREDVLAAIAAAVEETV